MDRKHYERKKFFMFWASFFYVVIQTVAFGWLWFNYFSKFTEFHYWRRGDYVVIALYAFFCFIFCRICKTFKVGYLRVFDSAFAIILANILTNGLTHIQLCLIGNWHFTEHLKIVVYLALGELVFGIIWMIIVLLVQKIIYPPHQMLLVYGDINPAILLEQLEGRKDRYNIKEQIKLSEGTDKILEKMNEYDTVLLGDIPSRERNFFLKHCYWNDIRCYSIPKISDILITGAEKIDLFESLILLSRNNGLSIGQRFFKRLMDIVTSIIGIVISAPFMAIIAIAIKAYDRGPVMYTQERLTKDGKAFKIYKFRSMIVDSERNGARLAAAGDDRITPVGKVIRRLHVDELPQLFNVFLGDMSLVGPRPERQDIFDKYSESIPEFKFRLKMKAGLTGYAQVYGKYNTTPYDKLKLDLTYIENYSLWLDIKLCFLTAKILFQKEKSEGVSSSQTTALTDEGENK